VCDELCITGAENASDYAGEPVLLEEFKEVYLKPYIMTNGQYREECKVSFDHSTPAPGGESMGGSAVQGL
jgi:hypothetical protein